tara:strand:- start:657 stop:1118 length:462 start_codon:yes stop_codon:yes gene_type:complete
MSKIYVALKRLPNGTGLPLPTYATASSAGADLYAAIVHPFKIEPGVHSIVPTGIAVQLPVGFEAQIRPRSGLALKYGITVLNSPGTIDADFRGEIGVILINHGTKSFSVERGMRIAQMVIAPVSTAIWQEIHDLENTGRGTNGFGSTGTQADV